MSLSPGRAATTPRQPEAFIPDLCQGPAVLMLVLVAELLALVLSVAGMGLQQFDWQRFAMTSLFVQWVVLVSAGGLCLLRRQLAAYPRAQAAAISYGWVLLVTALLSLLGQWLLRDHGVAWRPEPWSLAGHLLISSMLAGIALRYFYLTQELRLRQQAGLEARVQALQSRIRPHFLFNTMNSIASLIEADPGAAEAAVEDLAALFRASLTEGTIEVAVADELELCRRYLAIERWRLGDRLQVSWQLDDVPPELPIPSLTLQPLLENAVYHGLQQLSGGGLISVEGCYGDGVVQLSVSNPLPDRPVRPGNRLALDNIGHRLQALYGPEAGVTIEPQPGHFRVTLRYRPTRFEEKKR